MLPWFDGAREGGSARSAGRCARPTRDGSSRRVWTSTTSWSRISSTRHAARRSLYSREHYEAIRERLAEGAARTWVPLHQFDVDNLRTLVRTFTDVFPEAHANFATYNTPVPLLVLLGSGDATRDLDRRNRGARSRVRPARSSRACATTSRRMRSTGMRCWTSLGKARSTPTSGLGSSSTRREPGRGPRPRTRAPFWRPCCRCASPHRRAWWGPPARTRISSRKSRRVGPPPVSTCARLAHRRAPTPRRRSGSADHRDSSRSLRGRPGVLRRARLALPPRDSHGTERVERIFERDAGDHARLRARSRDLSRALRCREPTRRDSDAAPRSAPALPAELAEPVAA